MKKVSVLLFLMSFNVCAIVDPIKVQIGIIGGMIGLIGGSVGTYLACKNDPRQGFEKKIIALRTVFEENKSRYGSQCELLDSADSDQRLKKVATFYMHKQIDKEIINSQSNNLKEHITQVESLLKNFKKEEYESLNKEYCDTINQAKQLANRLTELFIFIKNEQPFIELYKNHTQGKQLLQYHDRTMQSSSEFPHITAVKEINQHCDALNVLLQQAEMQCQEKVCRDFQYDLINASKNYFTVLDQKRKNITNSRQFAQERERYERVEVDRKKAEADSYAAKAQQQHNENVRKEQALKEEQLRQNDEQLRQNAFNIVIKKEVADIKKEKEEVEKERKELSSHVRKLLQEKNMLENKRQECAESAQKFGNEISKQETDLQNATMPYSPESDEGIEIAKIRQEQRQNLHTFRQIYSKINQASAKEDRNQG